MPEGLDELTASLEPDGSEILISASELKNNLENGSTLPICVSVQEASNQFKVDKRGLRKALITFPVDVRYKWAFTYAWMATDGSVEEPRAHLTFSKRESVDSDDEFDRWARIEEAAHYLHIAHNPDFQRRKIENAKKEDAQADRRAAGISEAALLVGAGLRAKSVADMDAFCEIVDIEKPKSPITIEEKREAITSSLGIGASYNDFSRRIGVDQSAIIGVAICARFPEVARANNISEEGLNEYANSYHRYTGLASEDDDSSDIFRREAETQERIAAYVVEKMAADILEEGDEVKIDGLAGLLQEKGLSIDSLAYRVDRVDRVIEDLKDDEVIEKTSKLLTREDLSDEEILRLVAGTYAHMDMSDKIRVAKHNGEDVHDLLVETLSKLRDGLSTPEERAREAKILRNNLKSVFALRQRAVVAGAMITADLILMVDDLPSADDPDGARARSALLSNPEYVKAMEKALDDPDLGPLGPLNISPQEFVSNQFAAKKASTAAVRQIHSGELDAQIASFATRERGKIKYQLSEGGGLTPEYIEHLNNRHVASVKRREPNLSDSEIFGITVHESAEYEKREIDKNNAESQNELLLEPIAKVVVIRALGKSVADIPFESQMMGYDEVLTAEGNTPESGIRKWLEKLDQFLDKASPEQVIGFLKQVDFEGQRDAVKRVIGR